MTSFWIRMKPRLRYCKNLPDVSHSRIGEMKNVPFIFTQKTKGTSDHPNTLLLKDRVPLVSKLYIWDLFCISQKVMSTLLQPRGPWPARLLCPGSFPGKDITVGCHFLLQGIFLTQGSNPCLPCGQLDSLPLSYQGSPDSPIRGQCGPIAYITK